MLKEIPKDEEIVRGVLEQFHLFCSVAHGSGNEAAVCKLLAERLRGLGLEPEIDAANNLVCDIPCTPGLEHIPLTILQGHTDMVAVAAPGSGFDPQHDPITEIAEGDTLHTDGRSSLGADCGLGIAAVLYIMKLRRPHGPLRLILTSREEEGLRGAKALSPKALEGAKCLINVDGFCAGKVVVSSAGGIRQKFTRQFTPLSAPQNMRAWKIQISGLPGGHSGFDIDRVKENAVVSLRDYLRKLPEPWALSAMDAGTAFNAIPADGSAVVLSETKPPEAEHFAVLEISPPETALSQKDRDEFLRFFTALPHGVFSRHPLVQTAPGLSCNLGRASLEAGRAEVRTFVRCCDDAAGTRLAALLEQTGIDAGFSLQSESYPAWPGNRKNPLAAAFCQAFRANGVAYKVDALHVGLEPSVFYSVRPDLYMISVGMEIHNAHSTSEEAILSTVPPFIRAMDYLLEGYA